MAAGRKTTSEWARRASADLARWVFAVVDSCRGEVVVRSQLMALGTNWAAGAHCWAAHMEQVRRLPLAVVA